MASCEGCGIPCWSGVWYQTEEEGYLEISDLDDRYHRPPDGWELLTVDVNPLNSSQIFRYGPVSVAHSFNLSDATPGLLAAVGACGAAIVALPFVNAILTTYGFVA